LFDIGERKTDFGQQDTGLIDEGGAMDWYFVSGIKN
jgi:hypothetical protein